MALKWAICSIFLGILLTPTLGTKLQGSNSDGDDSKDGKAREALRSSEDYLLFELFAAIPSPAKVGMTTFLAFLGSATTKAEDAAIGDTDLEECSNAVRAVINDSLQHEIYATQMFDSWGTPEMALYEANWMWPGRYYECWSAEGEAASGMWCNAFFEQYYRPQWRGYPSFSIGSCFPRVCSESSVKAILQKLYPASPPQGVICPLPRKHLNAGAIICIVISTLLFTCVLVASAAELYERLCSDEESRETRNAKRNMAGTALRCFSAISNCEQILNMKKAPGTIPVLDGIRFLSTTWIILFHSYYAMPLLLDNTTYAEAVLRSTASNMALVSGTLPVDTFFFLSGLLVTYLGIKQLNKSNGHMNVPLMYLQRYFRLTPVYAYLILFVVGLFTYVGDGPYWRLTSDSFYNNKCKSQWFSNLLYFNNLYPEISSCIEWAWYLANDMQFYIFSPIFLIALYKKRIVGIALICTVCVGSMLTIGLLTHLNDLQPSVYKDLASLNILYFVSNTSSEYNYQAKFSTDTYTTPWCRISVYMIGMLTGYMLYETKMKIKMHKAVALLGWLLSVGVGCTVVYGPYGTVVKEGTPMSNALSTLFETFARPTWGVCVAWVVTACVSGYGGPVKKFLDWSVFTPLSRMTYSAYLVHILVYYWYIGSQETPIHFQTINLTYTYLGTLVISFGTGFILLLFIEWPFIRLAKLIFQQKKVWIKASEDIGNGSLNQSNQKEIFEIHKISSKEIENDKEIVAAL